MKVEVKLYVGGKVISEVVEAINYADAKQTVLTRYNTNVRVISVNAVFV